MIYMSILRKEYLIQMRDGLRRAASLEIAELGWIVYLILYPSSIIRLLLTAKHCCELTIEGVNLCILWELK